MSKSKVFALVVALVAAFSFTAIAEGSEASAAIVIEDSAGHTITLDAPANRVVAMGYAFNVSIIDMGGASKVVGYDKYSTYNYTKNDKMKALDGVDMLGTGYTSDKDSLITGLLQLEAKGKFNKSTDVVILNNFSSTLKAGGLYDALAPNYKVVCFGATSYDESLVVVEKISKIIGKDSTNAVGKMKNAKQAVLYKTKDLADNERPTAMYIKHDSGTTFTVYDNGIAASMITTCGAKNVGDKGEGKASHKADMTEIIQLRPDVVFLDGNYNGTAADFKNAFPGASSLNVVQLEKDWNNYCPSIATGLEAMYASLYEDPLYDEGGSFLTDNAVPVVAGILAIVGVFVAAFVLIGRQR